MSWIDTEMRETIAVKHATGYNAKGKVYGTASSINAYCESGFKRITNTNGEDVTASLFMICPANSSIAIGDEVVWQSQRYEVVAVESIRPFGTTHHLEVYAKSAGAV